MQDIIVFDIETVQGPTADAVLAQKHYSAPSTYKNPEKIEEYKLNARQKDFDKAALHWTTGKIISIAACHIGSIESPVSWHGDTELEILRQFFVWCNRYPGVPLCGKNSKDFDIPFTIGRAMVYDMGIPMNLKNTRSQYIYDIDNIFGFGSNAPQTASLNTMAIALGLDTKTAHGSDVQAMYNEATLNNPDKWDEIRTYNVKDTQITAEILRRYLKNFPI